ncbi:MAG TPA: amino acid adenylation domain-containing protein, partial [Thermoanaerobaculia bacterium]|nr:amino acid adenylation domain-containing protein [Thermoanaerobaculia bacterium]
RAELPVLPAVVPVERTGALPLSFAQQRLWFLEQLGDLGSTYHLPRRLRLGGELDRAALRRALDTIVARHEALRTTFVEVEGEPVQRIAPAEESRFHLVEHDLSGDADAAAELRRLAAEEAGAPFDLEHGPLIRGRLVRLSPDDHVLLVTLHHIVSDGWSTGVLTRELGTLYAAFHRGEADPLPPLPVQYADYAAWQRKWVDGEVLREQTAYWKTTLAGAPALLELPTDHPRPARQDHAGGTVGIDLGEELTAGLKALGQRRGTTLFMTLLAGWAAVLARLSGQEDVVVGTPSANRGRTEIEGLIGFFVNTLVMRCGLTPEPSFGELLDRVRETALAAYLHQDVPFERLVQDLAPERSLAHAPLFQVMLVLQNAPAEAMAIQSLRLRPVDVSGGTARFDLTLSLGERNGELTGGVAYATDLFDAATIERLIGHFERLLAAAAATPELAISALPILSPAELHALVQEAGRPGSGPERCIHELFSEQVARTPEAPAVVDEQSAWTYEQLHRRVRPLALRLRAAGVGPDQPVLLCAERGAGLVTGLLGILEAGGAYLAVEPDLPYARLELLAQDAGVVVAVTESRLSGALPDGLQRVFLDAEDPDGESLPEATPAAAVRPGHLAYVLYTSGSTGRPKGVMVEHRQLTAYVRGVLERLDAAPGASFATVSSFAADLGHTSIFAALLGGGCLHVVARQRLTDAAAFAELMERRPVDVLKIVPSHLSALLTAERPGRCLPRRLLVLGGEALPWSLVERVRALAPECRLVNHYGPTETTVGVLAGAVEEAAETGGARRRESGSAPLGRPLGHTRAWVVDRHRQLVPAGVPGELCVGGPQVARGYLGRPDLTAERFIPDPFSGDPGGRLYLTGDLARWLPGGSLEFLGRLDHQVKIRGFRIEMGEIETALFALPGIREAVVVAREDAPGDRRLVAYVTGDVMAGELRHTLREQLPDYMMPAAFVKLRALPLNLNGKVDRKALPAPEWQGAEESPVAPRTPVEEVLAGIWAELLGLERVGANDHFFDLGGHSLFATRVTSRLRGVFGIEMPLRDLFEAPRLADLATRIEAALRSGTGRLAPPLAPIAPVLRQGPLPLSFAQQRLWFIDQLEPGSPLYNIPAALRVEGSLDPEVLARCLGEIVRRHEALRTTFIASQGFPAQVIHPAFPTVLSVVDLAGLPERAREAQALALAGEEAGRPFDLARGPLLRSLLLRLVENDHIFTLTLHHIVSDGWSAGILVREVAALYAAFAERRPSPLPELPVQSADFAVWQRSWLQGEALESELSFWRRQLADLPPRLELPTDRPRPSVQSFRGAAQPVRLQAGLTRQAQVLGRREGATLFMVLLAGFQALLSRWSGQERLAVGSPVAGRNRVEIEGLIGFFVNTLVLRGDLRGNLSEGRAAPPTFRELLARVRETALAAHAHQDLPFERLVEELAPERSLAQAPLFQVMLALQNAPIGSLEIGELRLHPLSQAGTTAKFDLTLSFAEHGGELAGAAEYAADLFDFPTIRRLLGGFERLLAGALADPERPVVDLPLLSEAELHQVRIEWNPAGAAPDASLVETFESWADRSPDAIAVLAPGEALSYAELDRRADRLAHRLRALGVTIDSRVGLCAERSPAMLVAVLGILKAGAAYVPLDPAYPRERLAFMIEDSRIPVLLAEEPLLGSLPETAAATVLLDPDGPEGGSAGRLQGVAA